MGVSRQIERQILTEQKSLCNICKVLLSEFLHIDHIIRRADGGSDEGFDGGLGAEGEASPSAPSEAADAEAVQATGAETRRAERRQVSSLASPP